MRFGIREQISANIETEEKLDDIYRPEIVIVKVLQSLMLFKNHSLKYQ
jgi:hypothetical protein